MISEHITLTSGIVLRRVRPASLATIREIMRAEERTRPQPPERYDEDRGRTVAITDDPDYLAAVLDYQERLGQRLLAAAAVGLVIEELPEGIAGPESPEWAEEVEVTGFVLEPTPLRRWLQWLRLHADTEDGVALIAPVFASEEPEPATAEV